MLNNRELVSLGMIVLVALIALPNKEVRISLWRLVCLASSWKIAVPTLLMAAYLFVAVASLWAIGYWNSSLVKETFVWAVVWPFPMLFALVKNRDARKAPAKWIVAEAVVVGVVVEFLLSEYVYPLWFEVLLVPVATFAAIGEVFARAKSGDSRAVSAFGWVAAIVGFVMLGRVIVGICLDWQSLLTSDAMRRLTVVPVLSVVFIPCMLGFTLALEYDAAFVRIGLGRDVDPKIRACVRRKMLMFFGANLWKLQEFVNEHRNDLMRVVRCEDMDELLLEKTRCLSHKDA